MLTPQIFTVGWSRRMPECGLRAAANGVVAMLPEASLSGSR
jgi:hypothetical protein